MGAFKRGDWVRVTDNSGAPVSYNMGEVCRVDDVDGVIRCEGKKSGMWPFRFEPWTPKVGERVRFVRDSTAGGSVFGGAGDAATVSRDSVCGYDGRLHVDVTLDSGILEFNPAAYVDDLEPLPVAAEAQPAAQDAPAAPVAETLTIRAGGFYKTRDGRKVGPMVYRRHQRDFIKEPGDGCVYRDDGKRINVDTPNEDIIAEWPDTTTNVAATVDALDEEYGPVVADRDNDTVDFTVSLDTSELHEELDAVIAKLKKIRKLQRELGLIAA